MYIRTTEKLLLRLQWYSTLDAKITSFSTWKKLYKWLCTQKNYLSND